MASGKAVPLGQIFGERDRRAASGAKVASIRRTSTVTDEHYPMFVIPVPAVLKLNALLPHQDMLKMGLLVRVTPLHAGKIIFVS